MLNKNFGHSARRGVIGAAVDDICGGHIADFMNFAEDTGKKVAAYPPVYCVSFNDDGSYIYDLEISTDIIKQYPLSEPFNPTTKGSLYKSYNLNSQGITDARDGKLIDGGTKFIVAGRNTDSVNLFDLTTPGDISTISNKQQLTDLKIDRCSGCHIDESGTHIIATTSNAPREVHQWDLSTPWNLSTASYVGFGGSTNVKTGLLWRRDGKQYIEASTSLAQLNIVSLADAWDITSETGQQATDDLSYGLTIRFANTDKCQNRLLVFTDGDNTLRYYDIASV